MQLDFLYGTAWKEEATSDCVLAALKAGYRAIDTANQRKHYNEEGVGRGLSAAYDSLGIKRADLFLQTKFTYARGQDHRKPYDEKASYAEQVKQSFASSLQHLGTDFLDSLILHGPYGDQGLIDTDWEVWGAMEELASSGRVKSLGISNVSYDQLAELYAGAKVKPTFVQSRCYADKGWDRQIRSFCREKKFFYQGFSLLTANSKYLGGNSERVPDRNVPRMVFGEKAHPDIVRILEETGRSVSEVIFRFCRQIGIIPVMGSRSEEHLKANLKIGDFTLSNSQIETLENIAR
jgi:diketogulonate reductase-like aldo/keto reductase